TADVNHDGRTDYLGFGTTKTYVAYGGDWFDDNGSTSFNFGDFSAALNDFGTKQGYQSSLQRGVVETGYGLGETIYAQGNRGVYWSGAVSAVEKFDDSGASYNDLEYNGSTLYAQFGKQQGWTS